MSDTTAAGNTEPTYVVSSGFTHRGFTIGVGDPPPVMTDEERAGYLERGVIAPLGRDGAIQYPVPPEPASVDEWLFRSDAEVLLCLRRYRPARATVRALLERAVELQRADVLLEALRAILGIRA